MNRIILAPVDTRRTIIRYELIPNYVVDATRTRDSNYG